MNNLINTVEADLKKALLARDEFSLMVLRLLKTAFKNKEIDSKCELKEEEALGIIKSEVKKRKDAIELYLKGGREDLAKKEEKEIKVLLTYLPPELSEEEIIKVVKSVIVSLGEVGKKDFGRVMGAAMGKLKGRADGGVVGEVVRGILCD